MLVVYPHGVRVVVHTANLIHVDWNNKSQGLWMQDFPLKEFNDETEECAFENDLIGYLTTLKVLLCNYESFTFTDLSLVCSFGTNRVIFDMHTWSTILIKTTYCRHSLRNGVILYFDFFICSCLTSELVALHLAM